MIYNVCQTMHCQFFSYLSRVYLCNHAHLYSVRFIIVCTTSVRNFTMNTKPLTNLSLLCDVLLFCIRSCLLSQGFDIAQLHNIFQHTFVLSVNAVCSQ